MKGGYAGIGAGWEMKERQEEERQFIADFFCYLGGCVCSIFLRAATYVGIETPDGHKKSIMISLLSVILKPLQKKTCVSFFQVGLFTDFLHIMVP